MSFVAHVFLGISQKFSEQHFKEQSYFYAVDTLEETDGLLKDLLGSALDLLIHNICKFELFSSS